MSTGCNGQINTNGAADVEVEIYDDTTSPCTIFFYGAAPLNASYDARYSAMVGNLHRYTVYYEVPGSNNIQVLGWGDYNDLLLTAVAALEAHTVTTADYCPTAGNTAQGLWNYHGEPASQSTFANSMNLYVNGSWLPWNTSYGGIPTTYGYIWPPNGHDSQGWGSSTNPYQIVPVSNFGAGDFTEWKSGGPHA